MECQSVDQGETSSSSSCPKKSSYVVLCVVLVAVWGLLSLPLIFYYTSLTEVRELNVTICIIMLNVTLLDTSSINLYRR